jgi:ribonucleotide monophosphatase NagD (HAD superfamily)
LKKSDILMVGDTLETDILGANTFGLDTALVLSGNTRPEQALLMIQAKGIIPTHMCESVFT